MFGFEGEDWLARRMLFMVPLVLSLAAHEFAHAWTAWKLGDPTAASQGRLTLNPLAHLDPIGTLLPLLGVPFGWAKPVPINPALFSRTVSMETGVVLTAAAGPLSNLLIAVAATVGMAFTVRLYPDAMGGGVWSLLEMLVFLNVLLAVFNMIPVPPLDGSRVADGLMPDALRPAWEAFSRVGPFALLAILFAPAFFGVSLFSGPVALVHGMLVDLFQLLAS